MNAQNTAIFVIPKVNHNNLKVWKIGCFVTNVRKPQKGPDVPYREYAAKPVI